MARRPDPTTLVAGIVIALFGAVLMLDTTDVFDLRLAALAPIACAVAGAILLASGLARRD